MSSWHERLQTALTVRGRSWADLVEASGLTEQSVYAWRPEATRRTAMMNAASAARVCAYLTISPLWLFEGVEPSGLDNGDEQTGLAFRASADEIALLARLRTLPADDLHAIAHLVAQLAAHAGTTAV